MQETTLRQIATIPLHRPAPQHLLTQPEPKSLPTPPSQSPSELCKACRGVGRVYVAKDDPRITESRPCPKCGIEKIARDIQAVYPLPEDWENYNLADMEVKPGEERQYAHALRYAANPRGWIVYQGGPGTGKTLMFVGIMAAIKARGKHALFLPARTLGDLVYRALSPDADFSLQRLESDLRYIDFLVIDEMDKLDWGKPFVHDTLFSVLNWRYEHLALTAIAYNDDARIAGPAPALFSRMRDGRWGDGKGDARDDGIVRSTAKDVRPYLESWWAE